MSAQNRDDIVTPVGRIVGGSITQGRSKNQDGQPFVYKSGDKKGQPRSEFTILVAFEKNNADGSPNAQTTAFMNSLQQVAREDFSAGFDPNKFSWKVTDGDSAAHDSKGRPYNEKEGYRGCWVVAFKDPSKPPPCCDINGQDIPGENVKRGDYVRVAAQVKGNGQSMKPGLYISPNFVQLYRKGKYIAGGGPDASVFANAAEGQLPSNYQAPDVDPESAGAAFGAGQPSGAPGGSPFGGGTQQQPAPAQGGSPFGGGGVAPGTQVQPAKGFGLPGAGAPAPGQSGGLTLPPLGGGAPAAPTIPPGFKMNPQSPYTFEQIIASGQMDIEQMKSQGYLIPA